MALITLNLRDMKSGQRLLAEFETLDSCIDWLEQRPQFMDVLGTVDESLSAEGEQLLKKALRPYDDEENALIEAARNKRDLELERAREAEHQQQLNRRAELEAQIKNRGPNDAMQVVWRRDGTLLSAEPLDTRPIPGVVREAVEAWVSERDSWVHRRGQRVAEAVLTVWPGDVPAGDDRVQSGGQFELEFLDDA